MQTILENKKTLIVLLLFVAFVFFIASWYVHDEKKSYVLHTQLKISEQETKLAALAEITDRNGADAVVEEIIKDCSFENRNRFDLLLSKLSELNRIELAEIEQLFNACGNFYAERKAVMVARLEREFEVYLDFVEIFSRIDGKADVYATNTEGWKKLVDMEKEQSVLSSKLVDIQGQIINELLQNTSIASEKMQLLLVEGQQVRERSTQLSQSIDAQRQSVLAL